MWEFLYNNMKERSVLIFLGCLCISLYRRVNEGGNKAEII